MLSAPQDQDKSLDSMVMAIMRYMPLRAMVNFGRGGFTEETLNGLIQTLNQKLNG